MAAELFTDHITPAELTGYAREALQDRPENQLQLSALLPDQPVNDLTYRFSKGNTEGLVEAASFRSPDAEPGFGRRAGFGQVMGEIPPIGRQYVLGEYDQLRLRNADQEVADLLLRDAERIVRSIDWRLEFARAQALVEGRVTIADDGVMAQVDFARNPSHSVVPATVWTDLENSTPLDDLQAWRDIYVATNGQAPGVIQTSTKVRSLLCRSAQVRGMILPVGSTVTQVRVSDLNSVLADFDLPAISTYDANAIDQNGTQRRLIPDDKVLFLPANGQALGATLYGATLEAQEPDYGLAAGQDLGGIVVAAFKQRTTPIRVFTIGAALAIPILGNPDLTLVGDVI